MKVDDHVVDHTTYVEARSGGINNSSIEQVWGTCCWLNLKNKNNKNK